MPLRKRTAAKRQPRICDKMETNVIIQELRARASLGWNPEQQAWFDQQANDARAVQCVRMRDAFTPEQLQFLFKKLGYKTQQKQCYRNAAKLVRLIGAFTLTTAPVRYVEGFAYCDGPLPIRNRLLRGIVPIRLFVQESAGIGGQDAGAQSTQPLMDAKTPPGRIPAGRPKYCCGRYDEVKRRNKDRENSAIGEIPYFFLFCVGFSRYPVWAEILHSDSRKMHFFL